MQRTMKDISKIQKKYQYNLEAKNINRDVEVTLYENAVDYEPPKGQSKDGFVLRPNPIMRLDSIVGWHPHYTSGRVYFNHDPKLSKELVYT